MSKNTAVCMANSVDHDQMPCSASDLDLHCLQRPIGPNAQGKGMSNLLTVHVAGMSGKQCRPSSDATYCKAIKIIFLHCIA